MAFKNTNLGLLAYSTDFILKRARTLARLLSQSSATSFTPGNGYRYDIFTSPGSFTVHTSGYMDVMLVGGGGGGGSGGPGTGAEGGGGGAGGVRIIYNQLFAVGPYTVTIGAGGNGGGYTTSFGEDTAEGVDGESSVITGPPSFSSLDGPGGGGGGVGVSPSLPGVANNPPVHGQPGGSGGGAGGGQFYNYEGSGTPGLGYPGGYGEPPAGSSTFSGGGGGGASESGGSFPNSRGGSGISAFSNDTGIPSSYGTPGPGDGRYFGGGGDGGIPGSYPTRPVGGGGASSSPDSLSMGLTNTGGGGAGGNVNGYSGGPGIVIIRSYVSF